MSMFGKCEIYFSGKGYVCPGKGICGGMKKKNGHGGMPDSPDPGPGIICPVNLTENGEFSLYDSRGVCKIYDRNMDSFLKYLGIR